MLHLLFWVMLFFVSVYGWCMNIYYLITETDTLGFMLTRMAGVFVIPLGVILGFFH